MSVSQDLQRTDKIQNISIGYFSCESSTYRRSVQKNPIITFINTREMRALNGKYAETERTKMRKDTEDTINPAGDSCWKNLNTYQTRKSSNNPGETLPFSGQIPSKAFLDVRFSPLNKKIFLHICFSKYYLNWQFILVAYWASNLLAAEEVAEVSGPSVHMNWKQKWRDLALSFCNWNKSKT